MIFHESLINPAILVDNNDDHGYADCRERGAFMLRQDSKKFLIFPNIIENIIIPITMKFVEVIRKTHAELGYFERYGAL